MSDDVFEEREANAAREERGKTIIVVGFIMAVLCPPLGLILGIVELVRARHNNTMMKLAIVCIVMSIALGAIYLNGYMDHAAFLDSLPKRKHAN